MEKKGRAIIITVLLIVSILGLIMFFPKSNDSNSRFTFSADPLSDPLTKPSSISLEETDIISGKTITLSLATSATFMFENKKYSLGYISIKENETKISIKGNGILLIDYISIGGKEEAELNSDGYSDLSISLDSASEKEATFTIKKLVPQRSISDNLVFQLANTQNKLEQATQKQSWLIFTIFALLFLAVTTYIIIAYLMPYVKFQKVKAKQEHPEVMDTIIEEFNSTNNKKIRKSLYLRAKHLYNYLSDKEKIKADSQIKYMERYIN